VRVSHLFIARKVLSLKLTLNLKMDGWNTSFLLGWFIFRGKLLFLGRRYSRSFGGVLKVRGHDKPIPWIEKNPSTFLVIYSIPI